MKYELTFGFESQGIFGLENLILTINYVKIDNENYENKWIIIQH